MIDVVQLVAYDALMRTVTTKIARTVNLEWDQDGPLVQGRTYWEDRSQTNCAGRVVRVEAQLEVTAMSSPHALFPTHVLGVVRPVDEDGRFMADSYETKDTLGVWELGRDTYDAIANHLRDLARQMRDELLSQA